MSADPRSSVGRASLRRLRVDAAEDEDEFDLDADDAPARRLGMELTFLAAAVGFVLLGGASQELGPIEAKVGLSAVEPIGPFGQALGKWEPGVWVGSVLPCKVWSVVGGVSSDAIVRWPSAVAGVVIGLILCRSMKRAIGTRAAGLLALAWFGQLALIDRSADAGVELMAGLGSILALNRLLARGSGWVAGLYAAWAFLAGGWPPLAMIGLATIVLGRRGATFSVRTMAPVVLAIVAWSAWALATTRAQVWAAALSLPLTEGSAWTMALGVLGLGLPWSPVALLGLSPRVRDGWLATGRPYVAGWGQVALASLAAGTVVPGLASSARMTAIAGLAVVAAACWETILAAPIAGWPRRWFHASSLVVALGWSGGLLVWAGYVSVASGYYRATAIVLICLAIATLVVAASASILGDRKGTLAAMVLVAVSLKLAHWGHHVPEWNYRHGQGPWGRAIGQWVPPRTNLYVLDAWPADLAFAIGKPVRQAVSPIALPDLPGPSPKFVLLTASEYENWQDTWPKLVLVARFGDEYGGGRVLARTDGPFSWRKLAIEAAAARDRD
jgi:hypothetical protein